MNGLSARQRDAPPAGLKAATRARLLSVPDFPRLLAEGAGAAGLLACAVGARLALDPLIQGRAAFITFFPAIILISRWCSLWTAFASCLAATMVASVWLVSPTWIPWRLPMADLLQLGLFLALATWIAVTMRLGTIARDRIEERSRELEAILAALPVGIAITRDPEGLHFQANPVLERLAGPQSRSGGACHAVAELAEPLRRAAREGGATAAESRSLPGSGGGNAEVLVSAVPLFDQNAKPYGAVAVVVDMTAQRAIERRLAYLAETMPQLVWITGTDGHLVWTNRHWVDYTGDTIEASRAAGWTMFHPEDSPRMFAGWRTALDSAAPYEVEVRILRHADQAFRWFLVRGVPQLGGGGAVEGWIGTCTDIQDLKVAQAALNERAQRDHLREERLRLALDAGEVGTWEFNLVIGGLSIDARGRALMGISGEAPATLDALRGCVPEPDRGRIEAAIRGALASGGTGAFGCECRVIGATDGVQRHLKVDGRMRLDDLGAPMALSGTLVDLTGTRQADARDRLQAEIGAMLVESMDVPEVLGGVARVCSERLVDWCSIDLLADDGAVQRVAVAHRDPARVALAHELHRRYPPQPDSPTRQVLASGRPFLLEEISDAMIAAGAVDGEHACMIRALGLRSVMVVPLRAHDRILGTLTLVTAESRRALRADDLGFAVELGRRIGLAVDNARLLAAERAARAFAVERAETLGRLNAELEQFAYVCSHDLQEPLRQVLQYLDLARMRLGTGIDARAAHCLAYVADGAHRMRSLIIDLLGYARVGNAPEPEERAVDLERVLAEAVENLQDAIAASAARIDHDPLPMVRGNKTQLIQVLQNLIGNALKFRSGQPPHITISASGGEDRCTIAVADNGLGIPAAQRERIFEVFQRLHPRDRYPGSGIGLAICRKIIARGGGRIWADSNPQGGSVFRFTVQRADPGERAAGNAESNRLGVAGDGLEGQPMAPRRAATQDSEVPP